MKQGNLLTALTLTLSAVFVLPTAAQEVLPVPPAWARQGAKVSEQDAAQK